MSLLFQSMLIVSSKYRFVNTVSSIFSEGRTYIFVQAGENYNYTGALNGTTYSTHSPSHTLAKVFTNATVSDDATSTSIYQIQQNRQLSAKSCCAGHGPWNRITPRSFPSLIVDSKHRVMYCAVGKIGSTSWTTMLLDLAGKRNLPLTQHVSTIKSGKTSLSYIPSHSQTELRNMIAGQYYSFAFGRNPWTRLLSAWNDKFANTADRKYYHDLYGKAIIKKYRDSPSRASLSKGNDVRFPEFISFVVDTAKSKKQMDAHWKLIHQVCFPCQVGYTFLGQLENIAEEAPYIFEHGFKVTNLTGISLPEAHRKRKTEDNKKIFDAYRNIPQHHIDTLRAYYKVDFEIFGYSTEIPGS